MAGKSRFWLFAAACLLGACGAEAPAQLAFVGGASLRLHAGERRQVRLALVRAGHGAVAGASVRVALDGASGDVSVAPAEAKTDASGLATVELAASRDAAPQRVALTASAPAAGAAPIAGDLEVVALHRALRIEPTASVRPGADAQQAEVSTVPGATVLLRVRALDADAGTPLGGERISFVIADGAHSTFASGTSAEVATGASGEAQIALRAASAAEGPFTVLAGIGELAPQVSFNLLVAAAQACSSAAQCAADQVCTDGHCGAAACGFFAPCAQGLVCAAGVCVPPQSCSPAGPACPGGQECRCAGPTCLCADVCGLCAPGQHCDASSRACVANPPALPSVEGAWDTRHSFALDAALPTALRDVFATLHVLDLAIRGQLGGDSLPSWLKTLLDGYLAAALRQYLPLWLQEVVAAGDDLGTIFQTLRVEGRMHLDPAPDGVHLRGTEVWTKLVFEWLPLCGGSPGPGAHPDCARLEVPTSDAVPAPTLTCNGRRRLPIQVRALPFSATLDGAAPPFALRVSHREVQLQLGDVLVGLIDQVFAASTPYACIEEATDCANGHACAVDCPGLGADLSSLTSGLLPASGVALACGRAVSLAGSAVSTAAALAFSGAPNTLVLQGEASVGRPGEPVLCSGRTPCAAQLGDDRFDELLRSSPAARDGLWNGAFVPGHSIPGAWEALR